MDFKKVNTEKNRFSLCIKILRIKTRISNYHIQKPLSLLSRIILASTKQNAWILDPFAGSATTGIAANLFNRRFLGIDNEESYLKIAKCRKREIENNFTFNKLKNKIKGVPKEKQLNLFLAQEPKTEYSAELKL